jgi:hypothetical protein
MDEMTEEERKQFIRQLVKETQYIEAEKRSLDEKTIALAKRARDQLGRVVGGAVIETGLALWNPASMVETEPVMGNAEDWSWLDEIADSDHDGDDELITVVQEESLRGDNENPKPTLSPKQTSIYEFLKVHGPAKYSWIAREFGSGSAQHLSRLKVNGFALNDEGGVWRAL